VVAHGSEPKRAPEIAAPFVTQVASVDQQPSAAPPPTDRISSPSGKYRLQVAAVRSRSEAEALAGLLVGRHGDQLGGRHPEVDESVIGSMGTFYRVRLGPYASAQEPEQLCAALRSDGFDCLVLGQ
jgi:cell division septation protein DedD